MQFSHSQPWKRETCIGSTLRIHISLSQFLTPAREIVKMVFVSREWFSRAKTESSTASSGHKTILSLVIVNRVFLSRARGNDTDLMCNGMKFFRINWKFVRFAENYESANKAKEAAAVAAASRWKRNCFKDWLNEQPMAGKAHWWLKNSPVLSTSRKFKQVVPVNQIFLDCICVF